MTRLILPLYVSGNIRTSQGFYLLLGSEILSRLAAVSHSNITIYRLSKKKKGKCRMILPISSIFLRIPLRAIRRKVNHVEVVLYKWRGLAMANCIGKNTNGVISSLGDEWSKSSRDSRRDWANTFNGTAMRCSLWSFKPIYEGEPR